MEEGVLKFLQLDLEVILLLCQDRLQEGGGERRGRRRGGEDERKRGERGGGEVVRGEERGRE